jgi:hypothetical protein
VTQIVEIGRVGFTCLSRIRPPVVAPRLDSLDFDGLQRQAEKVPRAERELVEPHPRNLAGSPVNISDDGNALCVGPALSIRPQSTNPA